MLEDVKFLSQIKSALNFGDKDIKIPNAKTSLPNEFMYTFKLFI